MSTTRHDDNDGSNVFWPGYVDAVTNLVLNLLFLLTVMTVAVFMFALELGRASKGGPDTPVAAAKQETAVVAKATTDPVKENVALKREIQRLNMELAQRAPQNVQPVQPVQPMQPAQPGSVTKNVDVTAHVSKPIKGFDKALAGDSGILVRFKDEAIAFTPAEHDLLLETLQPIVARGGAVIIHVDVPAGFSEAKRMGYYRAMAVRNLLIELKMPMENIEVSMGEAKNADASLVRVK